ncbi:hypothetical protein CXU22_12170 [Akkermansia muciniphila]|uniref:Uncharacterized protein n=1 Tax=Akkermansia muciniphila TaxID=239935 RepID=A0A2N8HBX2_9BACT|nr:hypothetical protein [Akkermansia muciniphila]PNC17360.1 hypothetical protein CXU22_12170 [Akkermansia muciniphila]
MQRNECKPGTEVIIRGTIKGDVGAGIYPITVDVLCDNGETKGYIFFDPSQLEPAQPKYDPARKFRTGDKVRFIYHGRRNYIVTPEKGQECTVIENEKQEQVLIKCCGYTAAFHFADLELVKPVEEIEAEQPYLVKETPYFFDVYKKEDESRWYASFCYCGGLLNKEQAKACAEACCDELNRKHQELLNA